MKPRSIGPGPRLAEALLAALMTLSVLIPATSEALTWPWETMRGWPGSSEIPVTPLGHVTLEHRLRTFSPPAEAGFSFVVFGDQRALADGEWQGMMTAIGREAQRNPRLLFMLDSGDIVQSGKHGDQFARLRSILSPASDLPYLVAVGNHEVANNEPGPARSNVANFLEYLDPGFSPDVMYYRKVVGGVRFLFLDTSDLVYGDLGGRDLDRPLPPSSRGLAQLEWLADQLAEPATNYVATILSLHHPFVHASELHRAQAVALWNQRVRGKLLADLLLDGGVNLVLTGHTHTYERYLIRRNDGRRLSLVNLSGRPRNSVLWFGASKRRPLDLRGREDTWFRDRGWQETERWHIEQQAVMLEDEADQFAVIRVKPNGDMTLELRFQDREDPGRFRADHPVDLP